MLPGRQLYFVVTGIYALSRVLLYAAGVRYHADYTWQHFHDVDLLKERLWETLLHTHAFTPFINLLAGVVLKISEEHSFAIYHSLYLGLGTLFVCSLTYLLALFALPRWVTVAVVTLFSLTPAFIYFETLLHYEFIAASLLACCAMLFHRALIKPTLGRWLACFLVGCVITYARTTFHLVWLLAVVAMAVLFQRAHWRRILAAAALPVLLTTALYAKNLYMFGFFGTSSNFGANLAYPTIRQLKKAELRDWIAKGKIHPISGVSVYAGPEEYAPWFPVHEQKGVPVLDRFKKQYGIPNYNHWVYGETSKIRMKDNRYYLARRKLRYLSTVARSYKSFFSPTSDWHPHRTLGPHVFNRKTIGGWEALYNRALHTYPVRPFGLYLFIVPLAMWAALRALWRTWQSRFAGSATDKAILFMAMICFYVPVLSCLVTTAELARYRMMIEGFLWLSCLSLLWRPQIAVRREVS